MIEQMRKDLNKNIKNVISYDNKIHHILSLGKSA